MSIFKKQAIKKSFPAFDVVVRETGRYGAINITSGEIITDENMLRGWSLGSVASYALSNNECPAQAIAEAKRDNEALHWISSIAICISSSPERLPARILIKDGDVINFEGHLFTVAKVSSNNKRLIPFTNK